MLARVCHTSLTTGLNTASLLTPHICPAWQTTEFIQENKKESFIIYNFDFRTEFLHINPWSGTPNPPPPPPLSILCKNTGYY